MVKKKRKEKSLQTKKGEVFFSERKKRENPQWLIRTKDTPYLGPGLRKTHRANISTPTGLRAKVHRGHT